MRRVSSQQMRSADSRTSPARGERSPRFPIGVATSTSRPLLVLLKVASLDGAVRHLTHLELVADPDAPAFERPRLGLDRPARRRARPWRCATA